MAVSLVKGVPDGWLDEIEATVDWSNPNLLAFQLDGQDLVHLTDINPGTGEARLIVFRSTAPDADILFEATVRIDAHIEH